MQESTTSNWLILFVFTCTPEQYFQVFNFHYFCNVDVSIVLTCDQPKCLATLSPTVRMVWMATSLSNISHTRHETLPIHSSSCFFETFAGRWWLRSALYMWRRMMCVACVKDLFVSMYWGRHVPTVFWWEQVLLSPSLRHYTCVPSANEHAPRKYLRTAAAPQQWLFWWLRCSVTLDDDVRCENEFKKNSTDMCNVFFAVDLLRFNLSKLMIYWKSVSVDWIECMWMWGIFWRNYYFFEPVRVQPFFSRISSNVSRELWWPQRATENNCWRSQQICTELIGLILVGF